MFVVLVPPRTPLTSSHSNNECGDVVFVVIDHIESQQHHTHCCCKGGRWEQSTVWVLVPGVAKLCQQQPRKQEQDSCWPACLPAAH